MHGFKSKVLVQLRNRLVVDAKTLTCTEGNTERREPTSPSHTAMRPLNPPRNEARKCNSNKFAQVTMFSIINNHYLHGNSTDLKDSGERKSSPRAKRSLKHYVR